MNNVLISPDGNIDKEQLRVWVWSQISELLIQVDYLLHADRYTQFWQDLHHFIVSHYTERSKQDRLDAESQLIAQDSYLETWKSLALDTAESMELFIRTKAAEIHSGNDRYDYYWALNMRYDQLIALVRVEKALINAIERFVITQPEKVVVDTTFLRLIDYPVEKQIFLEAEKVMKEREHIS